MDHSIVRLCLLEIKNIKNVRYGMVEMPGAANGKMFLRTSEILGVYGQNGSGKTAVIDTLFLLQSIMLGRNLPDETSNYISKECQDAVIRAEFTIEKEESRYEVGYQVTLTRTKQEGLDVSGESLSCAKTQSGKRTNRMVFLEYSADQKDSILIPKKRMDEIAAGKKENKVNLMVAKKLAKINHCSYIFGEDGREIFTGEYENGFRDYSDIIRELYHYVSLNLFVIRNSHSGVISSDVFLPMAFRVGSRFSSTKGEFLVALKEPTLLDETQFLLLKKIVEETNMVLGAIVPDLLIDIQDFGPQILEGGLAGRRVELLSQHGTVRIPIRYESEGIVKIISILNILIRAYHDPAICLAVDELDAGIYEYLLGELLDIYSRGAKGQLIFTSHNLRPLEMLNKSSIIFSTENPDNRYIRMQNVKRNHNLRDAYLRCITLGGQKECIYSETDSIRIARAFRNAGRKMADER